MTAPIFTEQTVDWSDPAVQNDYLRLHRQDQWRTSRASVVAVALLSVIGVFQLVSGYTWVWLVAAAASLGLIVLRVRVVLARLRRFLPATDGLTRYRLEPQNLKIQNAAGNYESSLGQINGVRSALNGIVVQYARTSRFTLPDGPVCRVLKHPRSTAPGGTP